MRIISNLQTENHYQAINNFLKFSDELIIVSPYLSYDMGTLLGGLENIDKIKEFTLITTLVNKSDDLISKSKSLSSFIDFCQIQEGKWKIHINNKLHGKIYLFKNNNKIFSGIITSANMSDNGMRFNHEWGVAITDLDTLTSIENEIFSSIEKHDLTVENIIELYLEVDRYEQNNQTLPPKISVDISQILKNISFAPLPPDIRIFLKPIGTVEDPILVSERFEKPLDKLHFSKRKPVSVRKNDILICYGVGTTKLLSYFEVISDILIDENEIRWPYYVIGKNLSTDFGKNWNNCDLYINHLADTFKLHNPNVPITNVGGFTLGALNFGADKIRLTSEFGNYLINTIKSV
ncbi:restriction endonuclease PLD domain-containing protein [Leptospira yasudae]|uniref:NgoFVII family restriction endonuclease n=1 Tax=Leptospira yasudae TaxID=2202201 RepID=A0A6N4QWQ0_9LEPT|nr:restriction endonuclease PLD domain-containing protein [Leptospira yasudae]TGL75997.1 NgoFVII family restriction endonuclease [Leptospira yasudae]TGL79731.1 NgoFVII family restriction endonuclease [Leptospira yasudae]TGL80113.1 NgoFVII family restriction endonuclease [Leptospira yasudae]